MPNPLIDAVIARDGKDAYSAGLKQIQDNKAKKVAEAKEQAEIKHQAGLPHSTLNDAPESVRKSIDGKPLSPQQPSSQYGQPAIPKAPSAPSVQPFGGGAFNADDALASKDPYRMMTDKGQPIAQVGTRKEWKDSGVVQPYEVNPYKGKAVLPYSTKELRDTYVTLQNDGRFLLDIRASKIKGANGSRDFSVENFKEVPQSKSQIDNYRILDSEGLSQSRKAMGKFYNVPASKLYGTPEAKAELDRRNAQIVAVKIIGLSNGDLSYNDFQALRRDILNGRGNVYSYNVADFIASKREQKGNILADHKAQGNAMLSEMRRLQSDRQKATGKKDYYHPTNTPVPVGSMSTSDLADAHTFVSMRMNRSLDMLDIVEKKARGKNGWFSNFGEGVGEGLANELVSSVSLGQGRGSDYLQKLIKRYNKGEKLNKEDSALLDAFAYSNTIDSEMVRHIPSSYKIGETTGASIPFMIDFLAANAVAGVGEIGAKVGAKLTQKTFQAMLRNGILDNSRGLTRFGAKLLGGVARVATDAGVAGIMTASNPRQMGKITSNAYEMLEEKPLASTSHSGAPKFGGVTLAPQETSEAKAFAKSFTDQWIENWSEMAGGWLGDIGKGTKNFGKAVVGGAFNDVKKSVPQMMANYGSSSIGGALTQGYKAAVNIGKKAGFNGVVEENLEEYFGNAGRVMILGGDHTWDKEFSPEQIKETFVGLLPTMLMFGAIGGVSTAGQHATSAKQLKEYEDKLKARGIDTDKAREQMSNMSFNEYVQHEAALLTKARIKHTEAEVLLEYKDAGANKAMEAAKEAEEKAMFALYFAQYQGVRGVDTEAIQEAREAHEREVDRSIDNSVKSVSHLLSQEHNPDNTPNPTAGTYSRVEHNGKEYVVRNGKFKAVAQRDMESGAPIKDRNGNVSYEVYADELLYLQDANGNVVPVYSSDVTPLGETIRLDGLKNSAKSILMSDASGSIQPSAIIDESTLRELSDPNNNLPYVQAEPSAFVSSEEVEQAQSDIAGMEPQGEQQEQVPQGVPQIEGGVDDSTEASHEEESFVLNDDEEHDQGEWDNLDDYDPNRPIEVGDDVLFDSDGRGHVKTGVVSQVSDDAYYIQAHDGGMYVIPLEQGIWHNMFNRKGWTPKEHNTQEQESGVVDTTSPEEVVTEEQQEADPQTAEEWVAYFDGDLEAAINWIENTIHVLKKDLSKLEKESKQVNAGETPSEYKARLQESRVVIDAIRAKIEENEGILSDLQSMLVDEEAEETQENPNESEEVNEVEEEDVAPIEESEEKEENPYEETHIEEENIPEENESEEAAPSTTEDDSVEEEEPIAQPSEEEELEPEKEAETTEITTSPTESEEKSQKEGKDDEKIEDYHRDVADEVSPKTEVKEDKTEDTDGLVEEENLSEESNVEVKEEEEAPEASQEFTTGEELTDDEKEFLEEYKKQGEIEDAPAPKRSPRSSVWVFTSKLRRILQGVHYRNGFAIATDEAVLLKEKTAYNPYYEGKTIAKNGEKIEGRFPDVETAIPKVYSTKKIDFNKLASKLRRINKEIGKKNVSFVCVRFPNGEVSVFNSHVLELFCNASIRLGIDEIGVKGGEFCVIVAKNDKGTVLSISTNKKVKDANCYIDASGKIVEGVEKSDAFMEHKTASEIFDEQIGNTKGSVWAFTTKDPTLPMLAGVYHDGGYAVATNKYVLIAEKAAYDPSKEGSIVDRKGNVIDAEFPGWRAIIPENVDSLKIDFNELVTKLQETREYLQYDLLKERGLKRISKKIISDVSEYVVSITFADGHVLKFRLEYIENFANAAVRLGISTMGVSKSGKVPPIVAQNDNGIVICMPDYLEHSQPKASIELKNGGQGNAEDNEKGPQKGFVKVDTMSFMSSLSRGGEAKLSDHYEADNDKGDSVPSFAVAVRDDILKSVDSGTKPYSSISDLRKRAKDVGMDVDSEGRNDIQIQELAELGLVLAAREIVKRHGANSRESYDAICRLYDVQPTISMRSGNRIKMQQYSTPLPMGWLASRFVLNGNTDAKVFEPTAGNGMFVFAVPEKQVYANELDETRVSMLEKQGLAKVTSQDATLPFEGEEVYDGVIANPPFGNSEAVSYDGVNVSGLAPQIAINALSKMADNGRAAIIIGGNTTYEKNGAIKDNKGFFAYLYDHYNVQGVIDMDGDMYAKQGTTYPTRMILINGRRSEEERKNSRIYPPVQSKSLPKSENFSDLYDTVNRIINSNDKTNGYEVLRSEGGGHESNSNDPSRGANGDGHLTESSTNDGTRQQDEDGASTSVVSSNDKGSSDVLGESRQVSVTSETGNDVDSPRESRDDEGGTRERSLSAGAEGLANVEVRLDKEEKKRSITDEKLPYRPYSGAFSLESVAPAAMVEAMDSTLSMIESKHGKIDEFVRKELGYDTIEELHNALAAEQVDSVAMAIYQMSQGNALIIGDQTGVGKGRQMAALIRWATKQGKKPIFITQKADLFSDIYRDLVDVGSGDLVPFIFNSSSSSSNKGEMVDADGKVVYKSLSDAKLKKVFESKTLPEGYDYAVLTYSQVNTGDSLSRSEGKASKRSDNKAHFLRSIAKDNYIFLDESHTASGDGNIGAFIKSVLPSSKGATFASATFAKRPDSMPIYAICTSINKANINQSELIDIVQKGGVTLQEIMSRELTNAGQMVRRERDMTGVVTDWKIVDDKEVTERARRAYDSTIGAFNAIIKFQKEYVEPFIDRKSLEVASTMGSANSRKNKNLGVSGTPFASKAYNYTKQLMLAIKAESIVKEVISEIEKGKHPVIALESTMESSLSDYSEGEVITSPTFSSNLLRGLKSVLSYNFKDAGLSMTVPISLSELDSDARQAYEELERFIVDSTKDIYMSPIDLIIEELNKRGYSVGELTGRSLRIEKQEDGTAIVRKRTNNDKKKMQREFNNGELDVLILNKSASTGISLHASSKFKDQRQRSMIIAQPLSDINDYMQMMGRIDRTGQVHRGYYINLGLPIPAETRFLMMLSTKLKSLNANTTTSQDSESNNVEAPDILNKYGDRIVIEYLRDNYDVYERLGLPLNGRILTQKELDEYNAQEDDARRVTGYVALLSTEEQEIFYRDVVQRYNDLISYLDETNSNELKISVMPLRAKTLEKRVSSKGIDPSGENPFARDSFVEKVEMDVLRKPMKSSEIKRLIEKNQKERSIEEIYSTISEDRNEKYDKEVERHENDLLKAEKSIKDHSEKVSLQNRTDEEKESVIKKFSDKTLEKVSEKHNENVTRINGIESFLNKAIGSFKVGNIYLVPDDFSNPETSSSSLAVFYGYKVKKNGITPATTFACFATMDGRVRVEVKSTQRDVWNAIIDRTNMNWDYTHRFSLDNWDSQIPSETRRTGYIITGNILQSIASTQTENGGYTGHLVSYTDYDGGIHDGILMPDKWEPKMLRHDTFPISSRLQNIKNKESVTSHDNKIRLTWAPSFSSYVLSVPKSKREGAIFFQNDVLNGASSSGFYQFGNNFRADIPEERIEEVVYELSELGVMVSEPLKNMDFDRGNRDNHEKSDTGTITRLVEQLKKSGLAEDVIVDKEAFDKKLEEVDKNARYKIVFHGSPYDFDSFDHSKMGSGEGAQAYGWGTYVTEVKGIAKIYSKVSDKNIRVEYNGRTIDGAEKDAVDFLKYTIEREVERSIGGDAKEIFDRAKKQSIRICESNITDAYNEAIEQSSPEKHEEYLGIYEKVKSANNKTIEIIKPLSYEDFNVEIANRNLYTVEIPNPNERDKNGNWNFYFPWDEEIPDVDIDVLFDVLKEDVEDENISLVRGVGEDVYQSLIDTLGSNELASKFLSRCNYVGISYPAEHQSGGRKDKARNYVIFDENNLNIVDHVQFLKDGEHVYGFVSNGVVYLNPDLLNTNTPIHEFAHLWNSLIKEKEPELWNEGVGLIKDSSYMDEVRNNPYYSQLSEEDQLDEAMAMAIGDFGAKEIESKGVRGASLRAWIGKVWDKIRSFLGVPKREYKNLDDFARTALNDLLGGERVSEVVKDNKSNFQRTNDVLANEMQEIKRKAVEDNSFMKAPNGADTNLTERQWLQVRTKAFKNWFGDWEKKARIEKLKTSEPVEITGEEYKGKYDLNRDSAKAWIKDNLRGEYTIADTGEMVALGRKGVNKVTSHSMGNEAHLKSLVAVPEMLQKSVFIIEEKAGKVHAQYPYYRYYVVGLKVGGADYTAKLTIGVDENGKKYYDHSLTEIEKGKLLDLVNGQAVVNGFISTGAEPNPSVTIGKDTKLVSLLQVGEVSKVVDENGEPLVVYHGTKSSFNSFDNRKKGRNDYGLRGKGFYMSPRNSTAKAYGEEVKALFVNIRNPFNPSSYSSSKEIADYLGMDEDSFRTYTPFAVKSWASGIFSSELQEHNHDGVIYQEVQEVVAFYPNQIKSATDNVGSFDGDVEDIRYRNEERTPEQIVSENGSAYDTLYDRAGVEKKAKSVVDKLSVPIDVKVKSKHEVPRSARNTKGYYDPKSGEVVVVLENVSSREDLEKTILHEVIGHKGLDALIPEADRDAFFNGVYNLLSEEQLLPIMARYPNAGKRELAEEFIAHLAEGYVHPTLITRVSKAIRNLLRSLGFNLRLTDGEVMTLLYRGSVALKRESATAAQEIAYINQDKAVSESMSYMDELNAMSLDELRDEVGENGVKLAQRMRLLESLGESERLRYRADEAFKEIDVENVDRSAVADSMNKAFTGKKVGEHKIPTWTQFLEETQDDLISLRKYQENVEKSTGKKLPSYLNIDKVFNQMSSRAAAAEELLVDIFEKEVGGVIRKLEKEKKITYRDIQLYVMAKHAIERNQVKRQKEIEKLSNPTSGDIARIMQQDFSSELDIQYGIEKHLKGSKNPIFSNVDGIRSYIGAIENSAGKDIDALWSSINKLNGEALKMWHEAGMISKDHYNNIKKLYKYYVPLQGIDDETIEDVWTYYGVSNRGNYSLVKDAEGRNKLPDNPFMIMRKSISNTAYMAEHNKAKIVVLALAQTHPTDYLIVRNSWDVLTTDAKGRETWKEEMPESEDGVVTEESMIAFEEKMQALAEEGKAKRHEHTPISNIGGYRVSNRNTLEEHLIRVSVNGKEQIVFVNGSPSFSQAVNRENRGKEREFLSKVAMVTRLKAAFATSLSIPFAFTNGVRDLLWSLSSSGIRYGKDYEMRFVRYYGRAGKFLFSPEDKRDEKMNLLWGEFKKNGGKTGYASMVGDENARKLAQKGLSRGIGKRGVAVRVVNKAGNAISYLGETIEDLTRFAAYCAAREGGKSVTDSIDVAKEMTVNFNRRGKGSSLFMRSIFSFYMFINANIQGTTQLIKMFKSHPVGTSVMAGAYAMLPMFSAILTKLIGDDDDYFALSDYERTHNLIICLGSGKFIKVPMPQEMYPFLAIGNSISELAFGESSVTDALLGSVDGILDGATFGLDASSSSLKHFKRASKGEENPTYLLFRGFVPSILQPATDVWNNWDYVGRHIEKPSYGKNTPKYQRVYENKAWGWLVGLSKAINGDDIKGRAMQDDGIIGAINSPANAQYLIESWLGGVVSVIAKDVRFVENLFKGENFFESASNAAVLGRFMHFDSHLQEKRMQSEFYKAKEEIDIAQKKIKEIQKGIKANEEAISIYEEEGNYVMVGILEKEIEDAEADIMEITNGKDPELYKDASDMFKDYSKEQRQLRELLNSTTDEELRSEIQEQIYNSNEEIMGYYTDLMSD